MAFAYRALLVAYALVASTESAWSGVGRSPVGPPPGPSAPGSIVPAPEEGESPPALQLPRDVRPARYTLDLEVVPERERFSGRVEIEITLERSRTVVWLHGRGLDVTSAEVIPAGGVAMAARFEQVNDLGLARLVLPSPVGPGQATLRFTWTAQFRQQVGLFRTNVGTDWYAATQFEAIGARRAFPAFDEPFFKVPFQVSLTVPERMVAVTNATESVRAPAGPGLERIVFQPTPPLPTYLLFIGVGPFDVVEAPVPRSGVRSWPLPVRGLAPRGRGSELAWSLEISRTLLLELERYFGIPFPYEKLDHVAVADLGAWAMENAGAIAYQPRFFLAPTFGTSEETRQTIARLAAHEMAHQWFGDLVTPGWWTEIWLNESFATWMAIRVTARVAPSWRTELRLVRGAGEAMATDGLATTGAVREPLGRMADVGGQFDPLRYDKGAAVLAMLERWLGEDRFRKGIRRYIVKNAHGIVSTTDLLAELSLETGQDVGAVASTFLDQPGVPLLDVRVACDATGARLDLSQSRWLPRGSQARRDAAWQIPVCVRYHARGAVRERCELLATTTGVMPLPEGCPAWVMPNAGGAGYYQWVLPPGDLARLLARGLKHLGAAEKISLAMAVDGARLAGNLPYASALGAMAVLARDPDTEVARFPIAFLTEARENLVPDAAVPDVEKVTRALYRPAFAKMGWAPLPGEAPDVTTFRGEVAEALVRTGRDPAVVKRAAVRGERLLGPAGGKIDPKAVAPDLIAPAVMAAIRVDGARTFDALLARFDEASPTLRPALLRALGTAEGPVLGPRAVELWRERSLGEFDRYSTLSDLINQRATRGMALAAVEAHVDEMLTGLNSAQAIFPSLLRGACSAEQAQRIQALLAPRLERWPGMRQPLDQSLEMIRSCAARRAADAEPAAQAFKSLASKLSDSGSRPAGISKR
jgi:Peptidase family M1 domain/ERAP1-like C-terminal domain/Peptidase M1 N-terminal domain